MYMYMYMYKCMYIYASTLEAAATTVFLVWLRAWLQGLHLHHVELTVRHVLTFSLVK
jgi:hypothetical protein